ncbi:hypothetical protein [Streptomyces sp. H39-S7]|uniref:hypothetical protein n=1 Tax=Streptomyces sp. H39-S7 TaxID=3004357 RepID=UPI0022AEE33E|nr:hypothetical protein [Streptomyces sp. H39-S7]MCZ4121140.1 hypothetical protein [Streptomyces sp. H39-S7]
MTAEPPASGDKSAIPDDVWEKFVRDTEQDIRAQAPKEPSARARMVTERFRREAELAALQQRKGKRWGRRAKPAVPAEPAGWRTGPTWQDRERRATRRRLRGGLGVLLAVVVLLVVLNPSTALDWLRGDFSGSGASADSADTTGYRSDDSGRPPALPPETAPPTAAPSVDPMADTPTLAEPFRGSPALLYADGATGIVVPPAKAVGRMTRAQVEDALERTKQFLIDTNLNPATLRGERPRIALGLIDPLESEIVSLWDTSFRKPDKNHNPLAVASRFAPAEVRMVGDVVKTRGLLTFKEGKSGSVTVHADVTFVYGVTAADGHSSAVSRTIVRRVLDFDVADPRVKQVTRGKLWITDYRQDLGNSACDITDGFLHPSIGPTGGPSTTPAPSASAVDPYDRSKPVGPGEGCGQVTRV